MDSLQQADCEPMSSYPLSDIDVLIVGTGFAGLTAAIECTRKGHSVRVLERFHDKNTAGDMFFMGRSATRFLRHWPKLSREFDMVSMKDAWIETFKHSGECMVPARKVSDRFRSAGLDPNTPPGSFQMRPLVYQILLRQVERLGIKIQYGKKIVDYYEDEANGRAGAITDEGERFEADIVIAADGVGSKSQRLVGGQVRASSSGRAMWRASFPLHHLDKNHEVKELFKPAGDNRDEPIIRSWLGPGTYAMTLVRPSTCTWIINHDITGSEKESWNHTVDAEEVLNNMDKGVGPVPWAPVFKELIKLTPPKTIVNFGLFWRDPQPSWTSPGGRVIQIGDAAHSFLPASGNGATQAIEDAVSLATCLQLGGKDNIPLSVRTHVRLRFIRCSCTQKLGFANAELLQDTNWSEVRLDPKKVQPRLPNWVWKHDPERYAHENYYKMAETVNRGIPFDEVDTVPPNYPPGYRYQPWSIDQIMEDKRNGRPTDLGLGNWD